MKVRKSWRFLGLCLLVVLVSLGVMLAGCESAGAGDNDSENGDDGDSFRAVQIGIDGWSTWFHVIDSEVEGDLFKATLTRISDQDPEEGASFELDWAVESGNVLTLSTEEAVFALGRLNLTGDTYVSRDEDLTDDEGSLGVGVKAATDASNATLSGDYFVGMVHSDTTEERPGYFSGYARMDFDGAGTVEVTDMVNDVDGFTDYPVGSSYSYSVTSSGLLSIDDESFPRDLIGAVRSDGELFVLAETRGTPERPDNSYKTIFVGVKQSQAATNALLEGTWDVCSSCSKLTTETTGWWEGAAEMVIDAEGAEDMGLSETGEFTVPSRAISREGAVTPSGDTMVIVVYPKEHPEDGDYCLSIGIKTP
ncbi:MAG: hypothetical protein ACOC47_02910 [Alkalispirochaetaceae bacterium]